MSQSFTCPNCGADVPLKARACPECGSDKETGWSEEAQYIHLLPDRGNTDSSNSGSPAKTRWQQYGISIVAVLLIATFLMLQGFTWAGYVVPIVAAVIALIYGLTGTSANSNAGLENQLYKQLLQRARGDRALAERLLTYEQQRAPEANRLQLLQNAIYRWDRDHR